MGTVSRLWVSCINLAGPLALSFPLSQPQSLIPPLETATECLISTLALMVVMIEPSGLRCWMIGAFGEKLRRHRLGIHPDPTVIYMINATANKITAHSAGSRVQFRFAGGASWSGVCEFNR